MMLSTGQHVRIAGLSTGNGQSLIATPGQFNRIVILGIMYSIQIPETGTLTLLADTVKIYPALVIDATYRALFVSGPMFLTLPYNKALKCDVVASNVVDGIIFYDIIT